MSREIKFRAWDTSGEKPCMIGPYDLSDSIFNHKDTRLLPLMQYTGRKDKNGKEVYEDDVVKFWGGIAKVIFFTPYAQFMIQCANSLFNLYELGEVIGNIYENPELLNQGEDPERSVATMPNSSNTPD